MLLPLRQKALQLVWYDLLQVTVGNKMSSSQKDEYLSMTLWLPKSIRPQCIKVLSHLDDGNLVKSVQSDVLTYIESLEGLN